MERRDGVERSWKGGKMGKWKGGMVERREDGKERRWKGNY